MKSRYLYFMLVVLVALYGCQTTPENYSLREPLGSQAQANSGEMQKNGKPSAPTATSENTLSEAEADTAAKMAVPENPTAAPPAEKKVFGSWEVECNAAGTDCTAILRVKDKAGKQVFVLMIASVKKEGLDSRPVVTAWLPLGSYLPAPAKIFIGDQDTPFLLIAQYCMTHGCFAINDAPDSFVSALKQNSGKVTVSMRKNISNKQVNFSFTQNGFPEAYQYVMKNQ